MQPFVKQLLSRATGLQQLVQAKVSEGQQQHHHAEAQLMCAVLENPHRMFPRHPWSPKRATHRQSQAGFSFSGMPGQRAYTMRFSHFQ